jgi:DNA-binding transcriptional LysR family regulator
MDLRQLRYLVTLAEELHFRRAAEREHIAQSAFSRQIQRLERELGVRLLDRSGRQVALTQAGLAVVEEAHRALAAVDRVVAVAARAAHAEVGELGVGFVTATAPELIPQILRAFTGRHPEIRLRLRERSFADPSAGLRERLVDAAFVWLPIQQIDGVCLEPLLQEPRLAVLPRGHPLAGAGRLSIRQLLGETWCRPETNDPVWTDFWLAGSHRGGVPPQLGPGAATLDGLLQAVAAGQGVGLAPSFAVRFHSRPEVVFREVADIEPAVVAFAWLERSSGPLVRTLLDVARDQADAASAAPPARPGTAST